jgi:hypothetical protein
MMLPIRQFVAWLLFLTAVVVAVKDDSYYNANSGNPNTQYKMYWKDAENVLQDLTQFSSLYVHFHSCVWTWMKYKESDDGEVQENDYWYLGSVPPMGANVAFSLYGSLKNEKFTGCGKDTFINSFYTDTGFQEFAKSMAFAGVNGFSSYKTDDDASHLTAQCYGGYGVGCDSNYGFAKHKYSGSTCDPANYTGVVDKLKNLNSAMESSQCVQIFDSSRWGGYDYVYGSPVELLAYSTACSYMNMMMPDGNCPDPYGLVGKYVKNFNMGIQKAREDPFQVYEAKKQKSISMIGTGTLLACLAGLLFCLEKSHKKVFSSLFCCFANAGQKSSSNATLPKGSSDNNVDYETSSGTPLWKPFKWPALPVVSLATWKKSDHTLEHSLSSPVTEEEKQFGLIKARLAKKQPNLAAKLSRPVPDGDGIFLPPSALT